MRFTLLNVKWHKEGNRTGRRAMSRGYMHNVPFIQLILVSRYDITSKAVSIHSKYNAYISDAATCTRRRGSRLGKPAKRQEDQPAKLSGCLFSQHDKQSDHMHYLKYLFEAVSRKNIQFVSW